MDPLKNGEMLKDPFFRGSLNLKGGHPRGGGG